MGGKRGWKAGAAAVAMAAGLMAGGDGARAGVFHPETFTLDNGMEVVVLPFHRVPAVTHMVWYRVGAADEPYGRSGIAHLLEHLMFKNTESEHEDFSRHVRRLGGRDNAFTSWDYTAYFQTIAVDHLETVMAMEAERMAELGISDEGFLSERDVVMEERRSRIENNPSALLRERARATLYVNHPYRRPIIGWEGELRRLTRADAEAFHAGFYAPNNAILVVAGAITAEELKPLAERTYGQVAAREVPERIRPPEVPPLTDRRVSLTDARVEQPIWQRKYLAPSYNTEGAEHAYALEVLAEVISGGATSRLYRELVVEQELAAAAGAWYDPNYLDESTFIFYASPREGVDMADLQTAMMGQIDRLVAEGVGAEEVDRARSRMIASAVYARDSLMGPARIVGNALTTGQTVADVEAWPDRIEAVTVDQVNAAAQAVFGIEGAVTAVLDGPGQAGG